MTHARFYALFLCVSVKLAMEKVAFGCLVDLFSQESIKIDFRIERVTEKINFERKAIHQHYYKGSISMVRLDAPS